MKYVKGRTFSEVILKKHNLKVYANCVQCELTPHLTDCCFGKATLSFFCFGSPQRDYSLSKGDMTLEKGLRSQHSKDVQLHFYLSLMCSICILLLANDVGFVAAVRTKPKLTLLERLVT